MTKPRRSDESADKYVGTRDDLLRIEMHDAHDRPFIIDLTEFSTGLPARQSQYGFSGRPILAEQFAAAFRDSYRPASRNRVSNIKNALRKLFLCLDQCHSYAPARSLADIGCIHARALKIYCDQRGVYSECVSRLSPLLKHACAIAGVDQIPWETPEQRARQSFDGLSDTVARQLYRALCSEASAIKERLRQGQLSAAKGTDPRRKHGGRWGAFNHAENHLWLLKHLSSSKLATTDEIIAAGAESLLNSRYRSIFAEFPGIESAVGIGGQRARVLRCLFLDKEDILIFFALFVLGTGWNSSTAAALDTENWVADFPLKPKLKVLKSLKVRGGNSFQFALSGANSEFRPYQIIRYLLDATALLRESVRRHISDIEGLPAAEQSKYDVSVRYANLRLSMKSPWLFFKATPIGEVGSLTATMAGGDSTLARLLSRLVEKHNIVDANENAVYVTLSALRKSFAEFNYSKNSYQWLVARIALGHADERSIAAYLQSNRLHRRGVDQVRRFQDTLFGELGKRQPIDLAALRIMVAEGKITKEQQQRLIQFRTRLGCGCLDPYNPPRNVAPNHLQGKLCRPQRCTLCSHAVLFRDSLPGLARRYAELLHIQRTGPLQTWLQSDYPDEMESLLLALSNFPSQQVDGLVEQYTTGIGSGAIMVAELDAIY